MTAVPAFTTWDAEMHGTEAYLDPIDSATSNVGLVTVAYSATVSGSIWLRHVLGSDPGQDMKALVTNNQHPFGTGYYGHDNDSGDVRDAVRDAGRYTPAVLDQLRVLQGAKPYRSYCEFVVVAASSCPFCVPVGCIVMAPRIAFDVLNPAGLVPMAGEQFLFASHDLSEDTVFTVAEELWDDVRYEDEHYRDKSFLDMLNDGEDMSGYWEQAFEDSHRSAVALHAEANWLSAAEVDRLDDWVYRCRKSPRWHESHPMGQQLLEEITTGVSTCRDHGSR